MMYKSTLAFVAILGVYGLVQCAPMNLTTMETYRNGTEEEITDNEKQEVEAKRFKRSVSRYEEALCCNESDIRRAVIDVETAVQESITNYCNVLNVRPKTSTCNPEYRTGLCNQFKSEIPASERELSFSEEHIQTYWNDILRRSQDHFDKLDKVSALEVHFTCRFYPAAGKRSCCQSFIPCLDNKDHKGEEDQREERLVCATIYRNELLRNRIWTQIGKINNRLRLSEWTPTANTWDVCPVHEEFRQRYGHPVNSECELGRKTFKQFKNVQRHADNVRRPLNVVC